MIHPFRSGFFAICSIVLFAMSCSVKPVRKTKHIVYDAVNKTELNVFSPLKKKEKREVIVFIHGGNWVHGNKNLYSFLERAWREKDSWL